MMIFGNLLKLLANLCANRERPPLSWEMNLEG